MEKLDQAWKAINTLGGADVQSNSYDQGFVDAIGKALDEIEKLGGMNPKLRPQTERNAQVAEPLRSIINSFSAGVAR